MRKIIKTTAAVSFYILQLYLFSYCGEIILKNGTKISGTIISEKKNFVELSREGREIVVLKALIDSVDGKKYQSEEEASVGKKMVVQEKKKIDKKKRQDKNLVKEKARPDKIDGFHNGDEVKIVLKNGTRLKGNIISSERNFLNLDIYGTRISILKKLINDISFSSGLHEKAASDTENLNEDNNKPSGKKKTVSLQKPAVKEDDEILMKNGTVMRGDIVVRGVNFIRLSIDNSTVDILRTMIDKINGKELEVKKAVLEKPAKKTGKRTKPAGKIPEKTRAAKIGKNAAAQAAEKTGADRESDKAISGKVEKDNKGVVVKKDELADKGLPDTGEELSGEVKRRGRTASAARAAKTDRGQKPVTERHARASSINVRSGKSVSPDDLPHTGNKNKVSEKKPVLTASQEKIEGLIDRMQTGSASTRIKAAMESSRYGNTGERLLQTLADMLSDSGSGKPVVLGKESSEIEIFDTPGKAAAYAIASAGERAVDILERESKRRDPVTRRNAAAGLARIKSSASTMVLVGLIGDKDPAVQSIAGEELVNRGAVEPVVNSLRTRSDIVKINALEILGKLKVEKAEELFIKALSDNNSRVREMALYAIGEAGCKSAYRQVTSLLNDKISFVRAEAAKTLGKLRVKVAVEHLLPLLRDESSMVRKETAWALGQYRDTRSIEPLVLASKDKNPEVRQKAKEALKLHTDIGELIKGVDSEDPLLKENSAYILFLITGKDFGDDAARWREWVKLRNK